MLIECENKSKVLTETGRKQLDEFRSLLKQGEKFFLKPLSNDMAHSERLNSYYFSMVIPILQYHIDEFSWCADSPDKAHLQAKIIYCYTERQDLWETVEYMDPTTKRIVQYMQPFSKRLNKMSQKEALKFINFCKGLVVKRVDQDWEMIINNAIDSGVIKKRIDI